MQEVRRARSGRRVDALSSVVNMAADMTTTMTIATATCISSSITPRRCCLFFSFCTAHHHCRAYRSYLDRDSDAHVPVVIDARRRLWSHGIAMRSSRHRCLYCCGCRRFWRIDSKQDQGQEDGGRQMKVNLPGTALASWWAAPPTFAGVSCAKGCAGKNRTSVFQQGMSVRIGGGRLHCKRREKMMAWAVSAPEGGS